jgi:hypothetical protein
MARIGIVLVLAMSTAVPIASGKVLPGDTAKILGWHPKSTDLAYAIVRHRPGKRNTTAHYMKWAGNYRKSRTKHYRGSIPRRVKRLGYTYDLIKGQRLSDTVRAFTISVGRTLRVVLNVGKRRLSYTVWLDFADRPGQSKRMAHDNLRELWTDFDVQVSLSPDKKWAALAFEMRDPFRTGAWVELIRLKVKGRR